VGSPPPEPEAVEDLEGAEAEFEFVKRLFSEYEDAATGGSTGNQTP
jgi:hypothetical protein